MTKQILLYPGILVSNGELLFCVYIEVIYAISIQRSVFCVQNFVSAENFLLSHS